MDCLSPPLGAVPDGDWYCAACEAIVRTQYVSNSADEDSDYIPHGSFVLDLNSEVDITGSESGSESDLVMTLDSELESDSSLDVEYPSAETLTSTLEDVYVDVTCSEDEGNNISTQSLDATLTLDSTTPPLPCEKDSAPCLGDVECLSLSSEESSSSDSDGIVTCPRRHVSNTELSWSSSSPTIVHCPSTKQRRRMRNMLSEDTESDDEAGPSGGRGEDPIADDEAGPSGGRGEGPIDLGGGARGRTRRKVALTPQKRNCSLSLF